ncbi:MAG TPA: DUF2294 domain-containing protein [Gaiellaceae bacterium]|jgi:uncharacterized protein YbcI|nr:DUF2294 domain-containing protein [Gaiellaceae bacterium]
MASDDGHGRHRSSAQAISNAITKLQRENYGRGPENVRTVVGYDHIICFLENTFMPVERTLIEAGETAAVRETRLAFQRAMRTRFVDIVEGISGRKVRAFLSQVSLNPDIAVEVFVLERDSADPAPEGVA